MSLSDAFEADLAKLIFQNINIANLGDATGVRGSTTAGSLYIGLHTADPGEAGSQTTSEASFTNYGRVAVARSTGGFTVAGTAPTTVSNAAVVNFAASGSGPQTITHFSIGRDSSGAGEILASGALSAPLVVNNLVQPSFAAGALSTTWD